jgi:hypothetical protein
MDREVGNHILGNRAFIPCLLVAGANILSAQFGAMQARVPKGLYTNFIVDGIITQAQKVAYGTSQPLPQYPNPALKVDPTDAILVNYFYTLLSNPGVSGLAPMIRWETLNPNSPGSNPFLSAPGAYTWNALDDVFTAVDRWNKANPSSPKSVQLIMNPGFNSPSWVWNDIDMSVCAKSGSGCGSCDGLFLATPPVPAPSHLCGYTLLFEDVEDKTKGPFYTQFPLPLNPVYQADWYRFLTALNQHLQQEPSSTAFVAITVAARAPPQSEMILPDQKYWPATLTLPEYPASATIPNLDIPTAWNLLFKNWFGPNPAYQNSDLAIIEAYKNAIDAYSLIFSGITLELVSTGDGLPEFNVTDASLLKPAPGFEQDCDDPTDNLLAMDCAADTQVIAYFTNPLVGGNNAKLTFEAGMTASTSAAKGQSDNSFDIGQKRHQMAGGNDRVGDGAPPRDALPHVSGAGRLSVRDRPGDQTGSGRLSESSPHDLRLQRANHQPGIQLYYGLKLLSGHTSRHTVQLVGGLQRPSGVLRGRHRGTRESV